MIKEFKEFFLFMLNVICLLHNQVKMNTRYTCPEFRENVRTCHLTLGVISKQILFKVTRLDEAR